MKRWFGLCLLVFVAAAGWRIGETLSPDALSMAVGVLFGVMAGVPAALLVMAGSRRRSEEERATHSPRDQRQHAPTLQGQINGWGMLPYAQQPPVIVVAGPQGFGSQPSLPPHSSWSTPEPPLRHFTVVGDREELVEDW
jgi:hypothetical protein